LHKISLQLESPDEEEEEEEKKKKKEEKRIIGRLLRSESPGSPVVFSGRLLQSSSPVIFSGLG
jgi:hypothetical protein